MVKSYNCNCTTTTAGSNCSINPFYNLPGFEIPAKTTEFSVTFSPFENNNVSVSYQTTLDDLFKTNTFKLIPPADLVIVDIKVLKKDKVVQFTFPNKKIIKTICGDGDIFDFRKACFIAIIKYMYPKVFTPEGVEQKAIELSQLNEYNKLVDKAIKKYKKKIKQEEKEKAEKEKQKAIKKHKHEKNLKRRKAAKQRRIDELAAAIKQSK